VVEANGTRLARLPCRSSPAAWPGFRSHGRIDAVILKPRVTRTSGLLHLCDRIGSRHRSMPPRVWVGSPTPALAMRFPSHGCTKVLGIDIETGADGHAPPAAYELRLGGGRGTGDLSIMERTSVEVRDYCFDPPPATAK